MSILVTGATGFLGGRLVAFLCAAGEEVVALGRNEAKCSALERVGARVMRRDLTQPFSADELARLPHIRAIVHCAALSAPSGPARAFTLHNITATQNVADLARRIGVARVIYISTPAVYFRLTDQLGVTEDMTLPSPFTAYAASKRRGEDIVLAAPEIGPVVLRPRGLYGKGDTALLPRVVAAARRGPLPLLRDGVACTDLTHVDDAVGAIHAALTSTAPIAGEIFNISSGDVRSIRDIVAGACARMGLAPRWRRLPVTPLLALACLSEGLARWSADPHDPRLSRYGVGLFAYSQTLDISKADRMLGWRPRITFEDGLERTFAP